MNDSFKTMKDQDDKGEGKRVQQIYAAILASFILNFVPDPLIQVIASLVFMAVFIALYVFRRLAEPDGLMDNHMTYLIRSVWIGGLFVIIGTIFGIAYFIGSIGFEEYARLGQLALEKQSPQDVIDVYMSRYRNEMIVGLITTLGPGTAYLAYRFTKGLARAVKGYRVAKPLSWL